MSKKVLIDKQALIDELMKIPGVGSNSDALKTIKRFPSYEPQKVKVPEEFDEWYQQIKQQRGFSEMIARHFALWKICQFGFGHDFEDVSHERTPLDLSVWVSNHKGEAVHAILNGYEVEEEQKYYVELPFEQWDEDTAELKTKLFYLGFDITSDETRFMTNKNGYRDFKTKLDEETIKSIDERYWPFAVPVEEVVEG